MIEAVAAANPNTIVVLNTGGPVLMPWLSSVKAVVEAWYPGQDDGTAIASVLFGDIDPSGHLPETFPTSLSEIPTASPTQFPGVGGRVDYSEGLDVGYRWYDAKNVTPLFPFGYGLSYTTFSFSHLTVTPGSVTNRTSGPDAQQGQNGRLARVSARITNTGSVRGSDVMQLYVGDPKVAGEPPRQLEGFHRVTLQPGKSQTVTFTVTGRELSYFNTTANGWTLPNGQYSLYVGDSSALTSLPLRGKLKVTQTIGNRYARLTAPATINPGATFLAKARFVNDGNVPITDGTVSLGFPSSWTVVRLAKTRILSLAPGHSATRYFRVTVPEQAEGEVKSLTAKLTSTGSDGAGDLSATSTITVNGPITLTPSSPLIVAPGSTATGDGRGDQPHEQSCGRSPDPLPAGRGHVLARATDRDGARHIARSASSSRSRSPPGRRRLRTRFRWSRASRTRGKSYPLSATALTVDIPYASLQAAFDSNAISRRQQHLGGELRRERQQLLRAGTDRRRTRLGCDRDRRRDDIAVARRRGGPSPTACSPPGRRSQSPIRPRPRSSQSLGATSGNDETGTGLIEYTDGSTQPYTLTLDNWFNNPDSASNTTVATAAYINDSTGSGNNGVVGRRSHKARVFGVTIQLQPGKTVSSVTLAQCGDAPGGLPDARVRHGARQRPDALGRIRQGHHADEVIEIMKSADAPHCGLAAEQVSLYAAVMGFHTCTRQPQD